MKMQAADRKPENHADNESSIYVLLVCKVRTISGPWNFRWFRQQVEKDEL